MEYTKQVWSDRLYRTVSSESRREGYPKISEISTVFGGYHNMLWCCRHQPFIARMQRFGKTMRQPKPDSHLARSALWFGVLAWDLIV